MFIFFCFVVLSGAASGHERYPPDYRHNPEYDSSSGYDPRPNYESSKYEQPPKYKNPSSGGYEHPSSYDVNPYDQPTQEYARPTYDPVPVRYDHPLYSSYDNPPSKGHGSYSGDRYPGYSPEKKDLKTTLEDHLAPHSNALICRGLYISFFMHLGTRIALGCNLNTETIPAAPFKYSACEVEIMRNFQLCAKDDSACYIAHLERLNNIDHVCCKKKPEYCQAAICRGLDRSFVDVQEALQFCEGKVYNPLQSINKQCSFLSNRWLSCQPWLMAASAACQFFTAKDAEARPACMEAVLKLGGHDCSDCITGASLDVYPYGYLPTNSRPYSMTKSPVTDPRYPRSYNTTEARYVTKSPSPTPYMTTKAHVTKPLNRTTTPYVTEPRYSTTKAPSVTKPPYLTTAP